MKNKLPPSYPQDSIVQLIVKNYCIKLFLIEILTEFSDFVWNLNYNPKFQLLNLKKSKAEKQK